MRAPRAMEHWSIYARVVTSLLVITSPVSAIPLFLTLSQNHSQPMLWVFGVSLPSFRVGGGILLLLMAISMLQADESRTRHTPEEMGEAIRKTDVAVLPLATPLLAGPGAIRTIILYSQRARNWRETLFFVLACLLVSGIVWLSFHLAERDCGASIVPQKSE